MAGFCLLSLFIYHTSFNFIFIIPPPFICQVFLITSSLPSSYFHVYPTNTYVTLYSTESSVKSVFPLSGVRRLLPNPEFAPRIPVPRKSAERKWIHSDTDHLVSERIEVKIHRLSRGMVLYCIQQNQSYVIISYNIHRYRDKHATYQDWN